MLSYKLILIMIDTFGSGYTSCGIEVKLKLNLNYLYYYYYLLRKYLGTSSR